MGTFSYRASLSRSCKLNGPREPRFNTGNPRSHHRGTYLDLSKSKEIPAGPKSEQHTTSGPKGKRSRDVSFHQGRDRLPHFPRPTGVATSPAIRPYQPEYRHHWASEAHKGDGSTNISGGGYEVGTEGRSHGAGAPVYDPYLI